HALLAELEFTVMHAEAEPVIEAYAARLLAPGSPEAWRRWAFVQIQHGRPLEGAGSLRRYFDLAGPDGGRDGVAQEAAACLRSKYPVTARVLDSRAAPH